VGCDVDPLQGLKRCVLKKSFDLLGTHIDNFAMTKIEQVEIMNRLATMSGMIAICGHVLSKRLRI